jgi:hypothetical protein
MNSGVRLKRQFAVMYDHPNQPKEFGLMEEDKFPFGLEYVATRTLSRYFISLFVVGRANQIGYHE